MCSWLWAFSAKPLDRQWWRAIQSGIRSSKPCYQTDPGLIFKSRTCLTRHVTAGILSTWEKMSAQDPKWVAGCSASGVI